MLQVALHAGGAVLALAHGGRDADGAAQLFGKGSYRIALAAAGHVVSREDHAATLGERRVAHAGEQLSAALLAQRVQAAQVDGHVGLVEGRVCRAQQPAPVLLGKQIAAYAHEGLVARAPAQVEQMRRLVLAGPCLALQHHGHAAIVGLKHERRERLGALDHAKGALVKVCLHVLGVQPFHACALGARSTRAHGEGGEFAPPDHARAGQQRVEMPFAAQQQAALLGSLRAPFAGVRDECGGMRRGLVQRGVNQGALLVKDDDVESRVGERGRVDLRQGGAVLLCLGCHGPPPEVFQN